MRIKDLFEVHVIPSGYYEGKPLKDTDTIKVYHGANNLGFIITAITHGFTGEHKVARTYSYENNNNPYGLFVTPDLKTAKEFGDFIIEFHCRVSDLEAPVWPNGSFTSQGQMSGIFNDSDEREEARLKAREEHQNSDNEVIANSDRPELAATLLFSGERQALFTGSVNPHGIQTIWKNSAPGFVGKDYHRITPKEFIKTFEKEGIETRYGHTTEIEKNDTVTDMEDKLVKTNDVVDFVILVDLLHREKKALSRDTIVKVLKGNTSYIKRYVWTKKQYQDVMDSMNKE